MGSSGSKNNVDDDLLARQQELLDIQISDFSNQLLFSEQQRQQIEAEQLSRTDALLSRFSDFRQQQQDQYNAQISRNDQFLSQLQNQNTDLSGFLSNLNLQSQSQSNNILGSTGQLQSDITRDFGNYRQTLDSNLQGVYNQVGSIANGIEPNTLLSQGFNTSNFARNANQIYSNRALSSRLGMNQQRDRDIRNLSLSDVQRRTRSGSDITNRRRQGNTLLNRQQY